MLFNLVYILYISILPLFFNFSYQPKRKKMNFIVLEEQKLNQLFADLSEIKTAVKAQKEESLVNQWIQSETARKMLGVCRKTWQDYRDKKVIPFSQFGRKIFIRKDDLESFMQKHYIKQ